MIICHVMRAVVTFAASFAGFYWLFLISPLLFLFESELCVVRTAMSSPAPPRHRSSAFLLITPCIEQGKPDPYQRGSAVQLMASKATPPRTTSARFVEPLSVSGTQKYTPQCGVILELWVCRLGPSAFPKLPELPNWANSVLSNPSGLSVLAL